MRAVPHVGEFSKILKGTPFHEDPSSCLIHVANEFVRACECINRLSPWINNMNWVPEKVVCTDHSPIDFTVTLTDDERMLVKPQLVVYAMMEKKCGLSG